MIKHINYAHPVILIKEHLSIAIKLYKERTIYSEINGNYKFVCLIIK